MSKCGDASWLPGTLSRARNRYGLHQFIRRIKESSLKTLLLTTLGAVYIFSIVLTATALALVIYQDQRAVWYERHHEVAETSARTVGMSSRTAMRNRFRMRQLSIKTFMIATHSWPGCSI